MNRDDNPHGGDRRRRPNALRVILDAWPIVSMIAALVGAGLVQWVDIRREMAVFERRMIEADRRVVALEAADALQREAMTELKVGIAEIKAILASIRVDLETAPRPRRRAQIQE